MRWHSFPTIVFLIIFSAVTYFGCQVIDERNIPPRAKLGILDLSQWDLAENGPVGLIGEWAFYWRQQLFPNDFARFDPAGTFIDMPSYWNGYRVGKKVLSGKGFATYRLQIRLGNQRGLMALKLLDLSSAFRIWVNGEEIAATGTFGMTAATSRPDTLPRVVTFQSDTETVDLILQISNFHHRLGGPWEVIQFGREAGISAARERKIVFEIFLFGSILIMGIYHLCLFALRPKIRANLYFGIFCFIVSLRLLSTGEKYLLQLFPSVSWQILYKFEYLGFYLAVPVFIVFFENLFSEEFSKKISCVFVGLGIIFSGIVLVTPVSVFSHTINLFQIITILAGLYVGYALVSATHNKRGGAMVFLLGFAIIFLAAINDILYSKSIITTGYYTPFGFFGLIVIQAFELSRRSATAFQMVEEHRRRLYASNIGYQREITETKELFDAFMRYLPALAFMKDTAGRYIYVNDSYRKLYNVNPADRIGKTDKELWPADVAQKIEENDRVVMKEEKVLNLVEKVEFNNQTFHQLTSKFPIYKDGKPALLAGIAFDISDRIHAEEDKERLEAQLQRSQKMEALGLLAGGVAHDLNNVLSGIVGYPELMLMDLSEDSPLRKPIQTIQQSGQKAAEIVQDLLTLARRGVTNMEILNLNELIAEYLKSPEHEKILSFHPSVDVDVDLEDKLLNLSGSPIHLKKTIMNLVSNAAEAQPQGGKISIATKNRHVDRPLKGYENIQAGDYVVLQVEDKGSGIAPEEMKRIFEPFYTKKVMGRSGTGLGMAVVWGTVQDHDGYIHVNSQPGAGTAFEIYFPATREPLPGVEAEIPMEAYRGNGESILVVDDVAAQRELVTKMLAALGYSATAVSSGEAAIDFVAANDVDLLVLDMIMDPGMDGLETYQRIADIRPGQKAVIASGFSETDRVREAQKLGAGQYLKKPYTIEKIGIAVRDALQKIS